MKKYTALVLISIFYLSHTLSMEPEKGPLDSVWFYDKSHPFAQANQLHQEQRWEEASKEYRDALAQIKPTDNVRKPDELHHLVDSMTEYNIHKAKLNLAACLMAQGQETEYWTSFDALSHIPKPKHISSSLINQKNKDKNNKPLKDQIVLVRTDHAGIGDIFCFLSSAHELKKRTECNVLLSVPKFLKKTLKSAALEYGFKLIGADKKPPITHYETHLIALLGHLHLTPAHMNPEKIVFSAPEQAMTRVLGQLLSILADNPKQIIAAVFLGENRQTTLIGGKQLPHDTKQHGRHLDSAPFNNLLKKFPNLTLLDCGYPKSDAYQKLTVDKEYQDRCVPIATEVQPFDSIIALGCIMSTKKDKKIIAFGADTGPTYALVRSLDKDAQNRMAFIIPNAQEHDMRMEGEGSKYKQMISNCWVYKCKTPDDQTKVIKKAYKDMLK